MCVLSYQTNRTHICVNRFFGASITTLFGLFNKSPEAGSKDRLDCNLYAPSPPSNDGIDMHAYQLFPMPYRRAQRSIV